MGLLAQVIMGLFTVPYVRVPMPTWVHWYLCTVPDMTIGLYPYAGIQPYSHTPNTYMITATPTIDIAVETLPMIAPMTFPRLYALRVVSASMGDSWVAT